MKPVKKYRRISGFENSTSSLSKCVDYIEVSEDNKILVVYLDGHKEYDSFIDLIFIERAVKDKVWEEINVIKESVTSIKKQIKDLEKDLEYFQKICKHEKNVNITYFSSGDSVTGNKEYHKIYR